MSAPDQTLPADARLYACRQYQSVFPLPEWPDLKTWERQRAQIRRHLLLCAGLNSQTAGFAARGRVVKRFDHGDVTVENLCIETLPGLYLVGNLYKPRRARGRLPLVLHPHGHAMYARTVPLDMYSVPHRAMNCALNGLAAFSYSMIGYDRDSGQLEHGTLLRGPEKEICNTLGLSLFGLQLNNSIKALDYLLSRDDIDAGRVGCTGESGGGTQTYFLAAVDERVKVAAPAVMLSGHFQGGCVCENAPLLHLQYSNLQYAALIAPRPLLLLGCTGDWTHHLREREYPCLRGLYRKYGQQSAIDCFYQDEGHNYDRASREAVYAWMVRWLKNPVGRGRPVTESEAPVPTTDQLQVFDGPVPPYKRAIRTQKQAIDMWRGLHTAAPAAADVADVLQLDLPAADDILIRSQAPRHQYRTQRASLHRIVYGRFSEDSSIECCFVPPKRGRRSYLILRKWRDQAAWQRFCRRPPAPVARLMDAGCGVLVPRLFDPAAAPGVGEFRRLADDSYLATTYNRTEHMHRAGDVLTTVRLAQVEVGISPATLTAVADGDAGLLAMVAWSYLSSQVRVGPLVADLGGADLRRPATWVKRAYFPLLLGAGGAAGLTALWRRPQGEVSGVHASCRRLLPRPCRIAAARRGLAALLERAAQF